MPKASIIPKPYRRKNGTWEAVYYYGIDDYTGKRKKVTCYGKTEKETKDKILDAIAKIKTCTFIEKNKVTVGSWFSEWLEVYSKPKVKQSTFVNYRTHINKRVIPYIGHIKLSNLRVDILQRFFNEQSENGSLRKDGGSLSAKTIRNLYVIMHTAFKQAYENGLIPKNYIDLVKIPKISKKEMRVLSLDEHKRLYEEIKTSDERYKIGVLICLATGIRVGELVGLQWKDIDEYKQIIKIRRTLNRLPAMNTSEHKTEIIIDTPKSEKSIRDIPLPDFLIPFLNDYQLKQEKEKIIADNIYNDRDFIICNELGNPVEPRTMQDTFKRLIKAAGIENANFHCTRHTFATRAVEKGVDIKTLSEILGHADVSTTLNKYAHSLPEQKRKMMNSVSEFYD